MAIIGIYGNLTRKHCINFTFVNNTLGKSEGIVMGLATTINVNGANKKKTTFGKRHNLGLFS